MLERLTAFLMGLFGPPGRYKPLLKFLVALAAIVGPILLALRLLAHGAMQCFALNQCDEIVPYLLDHTLVKISISPFPLMAIVIAILVLNPKKDEHGRAQIGCAYIVKVVFALLVAYAAGSFFWDFLGRHQITRLIIAFLMWETIGELAILFWKKLASVPKAFAVGRSLSRGLSLLAKAGWGVLVLGLATLVVTSDPSHPGQLASQFHAWVSAQSLDSGIRTILQFLMNVGVLAYAVGFLHALWVGEASAIPLSLFPLIFALGAKSLWPFALAAWIVIVGYSVSEYRRSKREQAAAHSSQSKA